MDYLGLVVWWRVSDASLSVVEARDLLPQFGFTVTPPSPVMPIDAFRRLSTEFNSVRRFSDGTEVTLELHAVEDTGSMLVRHIVRTVRKDKVVQSINRVGDVTFYRPPRGQASKGRMRVQITSEDRLAHTFGQQLRKAYDEALGELDGQAIRRVVRGHLTSVHALYLGGPYFVRFHADMEPLVRLFTTLGDQSYLTWLPLPETAHSREILTQAIERAVTDGSKADLVQAYVPLGVVPQAIWDRLEAQ